MSGLVARPQPTRGYTPPADAVSLDPSAGCCLAMPLTLIYCAGGTPRLYQIAHAAGYRYGAQLPSTIYGPLYFADQDWRVGYRVAARFALAGWLAGLRTRVIGAIWRGAYRLGLDASRTAYMRALALHRPVMATVLDFERAEQRATVLDWAEEAAQYVERVLIIPKAFSTIPQLPRRIGGAEVVLAYSVPTRYGGTSVPIWEFAGWPIHLLGGSPQAQMHAYQHLHAVADVISADGNYAQKMAVRFCQYWVPGTAYGTKNRWWPQLQETDGWQGTDAPYEAFRRSCTNIVAAWARLLGEEIAA